MAARRYSFKLIVAGAMLSLILLVYGLVFHSTQIYRDLAIENQSEALESLLAIKTRDIIERSREIQKDFAFVMQNQSQFIQALDDQDSTRMEAWMVQYFAEQTDTSPDLNLSTVVVRKLNGEVFSQASDTDLLGFTGCQGPYGLIQESADDAFKNPIYPVPV